MKQSIFLIGAILLAAALLLPAGSFAKERIHDFRSQITVHEDGSLTVRETIKVRSEGKEIKRGIYREFPTKYKTASGTTHRLNLLNPPEQTPELFERFLPYALALDVEQAWAEKFSAVLARAGEEGRPYQPAWYSGSSWSSAGAFASSLSSSSTAPGSSSGGGGGGSSGGGGW